MDRSERPKAALLFFLILGAAVCGLWIGAAWTLERDRVLRTENARLSSQIQAQLLSEHAAAVFKQVELTLRTVALHFEIIPGDNALPAACRSLRRETLFLPGVENAAILDAVGKPLYVVRGALPEIDTSALTRLHGSALVDFQVEPAWNLAKPSLVFSVRLDNFDGAYAGAAVVVLAQEYFARRYEDYTTIDLDLIALYDPTGRVLASWPLPFGEAKSIEEIPVLRGIPSAELYDVGLRSGVDRHAITSVYQLPDFPYRVVVVYDTHALLAGWRLRTWRVVLLLFALTVISAVAAFRIRKGITDRTRAERALNQSLARENIDKVNRLERMRVLAGGLAHEVNNAMMVVLGNAEMVRGSQELGQKQLKAVGDIRSAAERAVRVSDLLLAAAGKSMMDSCVVDPVSMAHDMLQRLRRRAGSRVELLLNVRQPLTPVTADPRLLEHALSELLDNAVEALSSQEGQIELCVSMVEWEVTESLNNIGEAAEDARVASDYLASGTYVGFGVYDRASGMPPEVASNIFVPYFSTRFLGRGLGLAAAAGIAHQHGGAITVESRQGIGTRATLLLPLPDAPQPHAHVGT